MTTSVTLPANPYPNGLWKNAYDKCLIYEAAVVNQLSSDPLSPVIYARLIGYLIIHAPTTGGRDIICSEVDGCHTTNALTDLAKQYMDFFIHWCENICCYIAFS